MNKIFIDKEIKKFEVEDGIEIKDNKILISKDVELEIEINNSCKEYEININNSNVFLNIFGINTSNKITYFLNNSELIVQKFVVDNSDDITINLNSDKSKTIYRYSNINYKDNNYTINVHHNYPNSKSEVINHGINVLNNKLNFNACGYIYKDSINSICNQDNKIINLKDNVSSIKPILIIDNNMIEANHSAYIGKFKEEELFYLMSRGIPKKESYDLLIKAYLIGGFIGDTEKYLDKIKIIGGE